MKHSRQPGFLRKGVAAAVIVGCLAPAAPMVRSEAPSEAEGESVAEERDDGYKDGGYEYDGSFQSDRLFAPRWRLTDGPQVRAAFRDVIKQAAKATVCIHCDGKHKALGGVIDSDGWVVTKATPLCGNLTCILPDGRKLPAAVVAESSQYDVALVKVDAKGLATLDMSETEAPGVGAFLATVGRSRDPVAVGVVSVAPRTIPAQPAVLGVELDPDDRPLVVQTVPGSGAAEAGVKANDLIIRVDGKATGSREKLVTLIRSYNPGDEVELTIERAGEQLTLKATLSGQFPGLPMGRNEFQNNLGGDLSVRRFGFPLAFQHDTVLRPTDCGGPVVDLDGRVVGFNIARSGRTESYALPISAVKTVIAQLMMQKPPSAATSPVSTESK